MRIIAQHKTKIGLFCIEQSSDGMHHPVLDGESFGSYLFASQAADHLSKNVTFSVLHPKTGRLVNTAVLGIPSDIREWGEYFPGNEKSVSKFIVSLQL